MQTYPIGQAMFKNLHLNMGVCHHRKCIPLLLELVQSKVVEPLGIVTQTTGVDNATTAYKAFDKREAGWTKVELLVTR